jgi:thiamine pyrophosphokinase
MIMPKLITTPNIAAPDDFYEKLIGAHEGLSDDESAAFNARLILVLANHIGDLDVLEEALRAASEPKQDS